MAYKLNVLGSDTELAGEAATRWIEQLRARKNPATPYTVAVSGGRIARDFFSEITSHAKDDPKLFQNVHFFWADERCVPPTDPESNYAMARELLLEPLKIPQTQIHRLRGEAPEAQALKQATDELCHIAARVDGVPVFDMIFLGMGEDGHVASLFPGEPEQVMADNAVYRAVTAVKPPPRRMTLGYRVIFAAREVWVIAAGAGKEGALKASLAPMGKTPLARVLQKRTHTEIFTDIKGI